MGEVGRGKVGGIYLVVVVFYLYGVFLVVGDQLVGDDGDDVVWGDMVEVGVKVEWFGGGGGDEIWGDGVVGEDQGVFGGCYGGCVIVILWVVVVIWERW